MRWLMKMISSRRRFVRMFVLFFLTFALAAIIMGFSMLLFIGHGIETVEYVHEVQGPVHLEPSAAPKELRDYVSPEGVRFPDLATETWMWSTDDDTFTLYEDGFGFFFQRGRYEPEQITEFNEGEGKFLIEYRTCCYRLQMLGPIERYQETLQVLKQLGESEGEYQGQ